MEQILILLFTLVLAVATYLFRKVIIPYIKSNVSKNNFGKAVALVKIAVSAAEQTFRESKAGRDKKMYVKKYLAQMGIKLTDKELDTLIEAAVYELNNAKSEIKETIEEV